MPLSSLKLPIKTAEEQNKISLGQPEKKQLSRSLTCAPALTSQQPYNGLTPVQNWTQYSRCTLPSDEERGLIIFLDLLTALPNEVP